MNTRSNSDKAEVEKTYREAVNPTPLRRPYEKQPDQPQHTSTPFVPREQQTTPTTSSEILPIPDVPTPIIRKILSDSPLSLSSFGLTAPPLGINIPPSPIEEEEFIDQNLSSREGSFCAEQTRYVSFDNSVYSFRLVVSESAIETEEKIEPVIETTYVESHTMNTDTAPSNNPFATLRYAVEAVPFFDGQNIPLECFEEGCELAKAMLPPESEPFLTKIIHTRITGEARHSIQGQDFTRISQLIKYLRNLFKPSKNLYELQAELGRIYQKADEKVLFYANRVKAIGRRILEVHRASHNGLIDKSFHSTLEKEMCSSFIRGLSPEIEQRIARNLDVTETVDEALKIERELSSIKEIRGVSTVFPNINLESCQICKNLGHTADKCRLRSILTTSNISNEILICQICQKRGHSAEKCRFRDSRCQNPVKMVQGNIISCQICSKFGHTAQNCRSHNSQPNIICQNCHKPGHSYKECRNSSYNLNCQICNKSGHNAKNCYSNFNRNVSSNNEVCQWCERRGHQASQCQERRVKTNNSASNIQVICQLCNGAGHKARYCRGNSSLNDNNFTQPNYNPPNQCRYCKADGHLIENCVLRPENNRKRQGNLTGSPTAGATRGTDGTQRPVMTTQAEKVTTELL